MVVKKEQKKGIFSASYDDLDAVNDYIYMCVQNNDIKIDSSRKVGYVKEDKLDSCDEIKQDIECIKKTQVVEDITSLFEEGVNNITDDDISEMKLSIDDICGGYEDKIATEVKKSEDNNVEVDKTSVQSEALINKSDSTFLNDDKNHINDDKNNEKDIKEHKDAEKCVIDENNEKDIDEDFEVLIYKSDSTLSSIDKINDKSHLNNESDSKKHEDVEKSVNDLNTEDDQNEASLVTVNENENKENDEDKVNIIAIKDNESSLVNSNRSKKLKKPLLNNKYVVTNINNVFRCNFNKSKQKNIKKDKKVYKIKNVDLSNFSNTENKKPSKPHINYENVPEKKSTLKDLIDGLSLVKSNTVSESSNQDISNRYYLGKIPTAISMTETVEYTDLIDREIYDKLEKRTTRGSLTTNYVKLINNEFICYRSKQISTSKISPEETVFQLPYVQGFCYPLKYKINLIDSKLYIVTGKPEYYSSIFCCYKPKINKNIFHEITDTKIQNVIKTGDKYYVSFESNDKCGLAVVNDLEFVIFKDDEYYWFKVSDITEYIKWISALQGRSKNRL